ALARLLRRHRQSQHRHGGDNDRRYPQSPAPFTLYWAGCSRDSTMNKDAARLVLVVEDDVSVRRPLVKFLEMHGFSVVTAETADEGLDALRKNRVVAAVVDLRLRRGSGRDVVVATPADIPV